MRIHKISILCFTALLCNPAISMGVKNQVEPSEPKSESITGTQAELAEKLVKAARWVEFPELNKILAPLENEFKALDMPAKPFEKTFNKLNEMVMQIVKPILNVIKKPLTQQASQYFTSDELKELIQIYQKPVMQKQQDFMLSLLLNTGLSVLQDPAIMAQYTQEFMGVFMSMALFNNPKANQTKFEDVAKHFKEDLETFQKNIKFDDPAFKEKLKNRYKSIENIIQTFDFSKTPEFLNHLSKMLEHKIGIQQNTPLAFPQEFDVVPQDMPQMQSIIPQPENLNLLDNSNKTSQP